MGNQRLGHDPGGGAKEGSAQQLMRDYFHAKDENRPHLMPSVFDGSAILEMAVNTGTISFPPVTRGVSAIADVLVRRFGQTYENVYSFYMQKPPAAAADFGCDWMVVMSEKDSHSVRVGCGRYHWYFQQHPPFLVERLVVTVEAMQVLAPQALSSVMNWAGSLPYPWCSAEAAAQTAPPLGELAPVIAYLLRTPGPL